MSEIYIKLIKEKLCEKRFKHSMSTAEFCRELAEKNNFDPKKAYLAGILHDICKEMHPDEMQKLAFMTVTDPVEMQTPKLWHAPAGAVYIKDTLGIKDDDIFAAVRFHTTGRADMSVLEKILYLGDLTEPGRKYPEVELYRNYAIADLNEGMYRALAWYIENCTKKQKLIPKNTYEAYNYYNRYNQ